MMIKKYLIGFLLLLLGVGAGYYARFYQEKTLPVGRAAHHEIQNLLISKLGMRLDREHLFNHEKATSSDGSLVASDMSHHNNHFIQVTDSRKNTLHHYVNTAIDGMIDELGDLHFSPDGKNLAYALYGFNAAATDDQKLISGMSYVYIINIETGVQKLFQVNKKDGIILRITGWKNEQPDVIEESITEKKRPGIIPEIFIPYTDK